MEKMKKTSKLFVCIGLILCLVSSIGACLVQNSFGKVKVEDVKFVTTTGYEMTGTMYIPDGVSADKKVPAIVVSHGMYNNREMQDLNFVELSRRGFVVLSMDMLSHGDSAPVSDAGTITTGMYEAVKMLASISYVDANKIGITGHSLGGMSCNVAIALDNAAETHLISAVLLNSADATYTDDSGEYVNIYGDRDAGIIAGQYDEWFFRQDNGNGGTTVPRDFINNSNAQSFLSFGAKPSDTEKKTSYNVYHKDINGKDAMRVIYNPSFIHPWSHFSQRSTVATIEFFSEALGAPNAIPATSQVWQVKVFFNLLGLIGFFMFLANFAIMLLYTRPFESLRAEEPAAPLLLTGKKGKAWFWGSLAAGAIFGTLTYLPILNGVKGNVMARDLFPQSSPWGVGMWAAICGIFAIISMVLSYKLNGKSEGFDLKVRGVSMDIKKLGKSILLALIVIVASYGLVFASDYFFNTDYRIWVIALRAFTVDKIPLMLLPALPLFLIYYVANSVAVNSFNFNNLGKRPWVNTLVVAAINGIPAFILLLIQYITFRTTGEMKFSENMYIVWLFPVAVYLPLTAVISRRIYKASYNPYIGGIINAAIITMISCANTLTFA